MENRNNQWLIVTVLTLSAIAFPKLALASLKNPSFRTADLGNFSIVTQGIPRSMALETEIFAIEGLKNKLKDAFPYDQAQFATAKTNIAKILYQEASRITEKAKEEFTFFHPAQFTSNLKIDNVISDSDSQDQDFFIKNNSATSSDWIQNTNFINPVLFTLGNTVRFAYSAVSFHLETMRINNSAMIADSDVKVVKDFYDDWTISLLGIGMLSVGLALTYKFHRQ
jgi:hypothetical protein